MMNNYFLGRNPTPHEGAVAWEALNPHDPRLLSISTEMQMMEFPHKRAVQMWDDIYENYYYSRLRQVETHI